MKIFEKIHYPFEFWDRHFGPAGKDFVIYIRPVHINQNIYERVGNRRLVRNMMQKIFWGPKTEPWE
jgi:hypothetical protein